MVEGDLLEGELGPRPRGRQLLPGDRPDRRGLIREEVGQHDRMLHGGQLGADRREHLGAVEVLACVAVPVHRQQHLRLDLGEAVDHAARPELRGGARPDRSDAAHGQEGDQGLGDVRHVGDDPVPATDPERPQAPGDRRHLCGELSPRDLSQLPQLGGVQHGNPLGVAPGQEVLRVVQLRSLKPARSRHLARGEHTLVGLRGAHLAELPDARPELLELPHRPAPQLPVVGEVLPVALADPAHEAGHLGALDELRGGAPEGLLGESV